MLKEERKKENGWPIEDDELDNVSGGMRPVHTGARECPFCSLRNRESEVNFISTNPLTIQCLYCGCKYIYDEPSGKQTIVAPGST